VGYDSSKAPSYQPTLPVSTSSQMVTFRVRESNGMDVVFTLRTSGTEPKIKFYSEGIGKVEDKTGSETRLHRIVNVLIFGLLCPDKYQLIGAK
jgi:phosphomannomutase